MSALSDRSIRDLVKAGWLFPDGYAEGALQPVSVDVTFGGVRRRDGRVWAPALGDWTLAPGEFILGVVRERVRMPENVMGMVEGKSTNAREGLQVHAAGLLDPGFAGSITLELKNLHHRDPLELVIGEPVAQVWFQWTDWPVERVYGHPDLGSHYQGQEGPTPSWRASGPPFILRMNDISKKKKKKKK